jgi:hypothetical protein
MMVVKSTDVGEGDALFQAAQRWDDLAGATSRRRRRVAENGRHDALNGVLRKGHSVISS